MEERKIVHGCKNGDLRSFERVFELYGRKLFGLCFRMTGSYADAEDLMQEVFMTVLTKIKAFREEARFSTWLYRVAVNKCISHLRKNRQVFVSSENGDETIEELRVKQPPVLKRTALEGAIAELPHGYKTAVILHDIQGFNHKEIGEIMGITEGASKSQLFKARRKLRDILETPKAQTETATSAAKG